MSETLSDDPNRGDPQWSSWPMPAAVVALSIVVLLIVPYFLTTVSSKSICWSEAKIVGATEKIHAAKLWLKLSRYPFVNRSDCCEVSKGVGKYVGMGTGAFFLHDKAHYVFVPKRLDSTVSTGIYRPEDWNVVTVDICGKALLEGMDL